MRGTFDWLNTHYLSKRGFAAGSEWIGRLDEVKEVELGFTCGTNGREGRSPIPIPTHRWEDIIKIGLECIRWDNVNWTPVAHHRTDKWRALVNMVMNIWAPWYMGIFLTLCGRIRCSRIWLHGVLYTLLIFSLFNAVYTIAFLSLLQIIYSKSVPWSEKPSCSSM
jgi:hypothetical protein